jgi:hypothetical protein
MDFCIFNVQIQPGKLAPTTPPAKIPEFKVSAVQVRKLEETAVSQQLMTAVPTYAIPQIKSYDRLALAGLEKIIALKPTVIKGLAVDPDFMVPDHDPSNLKRRFAHAYHDGEMGRRQAVCGNGLQPARGRSVGRRPGQRGSAVGNAADRPVGLHGL